MNVISLTRRGGWESAARLPIVVPVSLTEYHLIRRRLRSAEADGPEAGQDPEAGQGASQEQGLAPASVKRMPPPPEPCPAGSQRLEARVVAPLEPLAPASEDGQAWSRFEAETADIELPDLALPPDEPWMPVLSVRFGDQQILIVHRGVEVELVLPNGQRMAGGRESARALAEALTRGRRAR